MSLNPKFKTFKFPNPTENEAYAISSRKGSSSNKKW